MNPRLVLLVAWVLAWTLAQATVQVPDTAGRADSLLRVLRIQKEDTNKVITLLALAEMPVKDPRFAPVGNRTVHAQYAVEALRLSEQLNWRKGIAYGAMYASMGQEQEGELLWALQLLDTALLAARQLDKHDHGTILQRAALLYCVQVRWLDIADSLTDLSINCFTASGSTAQVGSGLELLARSQMFRRNWVKAILAYNETIDFCKRNRLAPTLALAYEKMGSVMSALGDMDKAGKYFTMGIQLNDSLGEAYRAYMCRNNYAGALLDNGHALEALPLVKAAREAVLANGLSTSELEGLDCLRAKALVMLDSMEAAGELITAMRAVQTIPLSNLDYIEPAWMLHQHRPREAIKMLLGVYGITHGGGWENDRISWTACEQLADGYKQLGQDSTALAWTDSARQWERVVRYADQTNAAYRAEADRLIQDRVLADSLMHVNEKHRMELANERMLSQEKSRRNGFLYAGLVVLLVAGGLWNRLRRTRRAKRAVEREQAVSEGLLLNILPAEVAQELKAKGHADAKHFDNVTILFTDFKGFTQASEKLTPQELVEELNTCFMAFDHLITAHGLEKIKTIGDAYMCAGGLPDPSSSTPAAVVHAALQMQAFMLARKKDRDAEGKPAFEMRAGIHTGPVVAGIVGVKKFAYDIWGDTVNIASRMESSGEVGQVNISESTYELVKSGTGLTFKPRGKVQAKGKGEMEMYFVEADRTVADRTYNSTDT